MHTASVPSLPRPETEREVQDSSHDVALAVCKGSCHVREATLFCRSLEAIYELCVSLKFTYLNARGHMVHFRSIQRSFSDSHVLKYMPASNIHVSCSPLASQHVNACCREYRLPLLIFFQSLLDIAQTTAHRHGAAGKV